MFSPEHLALRLIRLESREQWVNQANRLAFIFPKAGGGAFVSPAVTHRLSPGDVLVHNGTPDSRLFADDGSDLAFWFFSACLEHLLPLFASSEIRLMQDLAENLKLARRHDGSDPLARECHQLLAETTSRSNLVHRGQLLRVIAVILGAEFKSAPAHRAGFVRADEHMAQVFEKLSDDDLLDLSVGELAARFGCSKRHLNRLFHQHFGFSVAAMRMEMRLLKAVSLLRDPDAKIIHTAEQCGFNHLGLFNTCFKRRFGASPSQYRKTMAQAEGQPIRPGGSGPVCPLRTHGFCPWVAR